MYTVHCTKPSSATGTTRWSQGTNQEQKGIIFTLLDRHYTVYCSQGTIYSIQHTVYSVEYTVYSIRYTVYSIHCLCSVGALNGQQCNITVQCFLHGNRYQVMVKHCAPLYCTTVHCTALQYTVLHYSTLYCNEMHFITMHWAALHYSTLQCAMCNSVSWLQLPV